ncbi:HDIG domain-containing metalloprotein [Pseudoalteromonas sp. KAN5]|uniref:HD domain-containing protein n=1 Tax=Pseudoalteromonas sp. KAN5 TaxID=2916633 RepID=UPI001FCC9BDC|nr:HDIG domain-containing metalloprotein [Pseudoalteromonas sp. KAN5]BDF94136.1 hypothetical protein KAN5_09740 [Pseudoalteromonas sp. KAN5]
MQTIKQVNKTLNEITCLYDNFADQHYDEARTQREHALQCAALAEQRGYHKDLVVAALLHDIGHLIAAQQQLPELDQQGYCKHSLLGAQWLCAHGFNQHVANMIENHVQAKRYLVATDPHYRQKLSPASAKTLVQQGGSLTQAQQITFAAHADFKNTILLRRIDDEGKVEGLKTRSFAYWLDYLRDYLSTE